jgi:hypothetical protein
LPKDAILHQFDAGEYFIETEGFKDDRYFYVLNWLVYPRPNQATALNKLTLTADGIDTITITNAPSGTFTATNTTTRETVTGPISGTDTFSTTVPGTIKVKIESWPYLDFEATIEAQ